MCRFGFKNKISSILLLISIVSVKNYAFQTSSESTNPFNEFMSPSGGVNLYSGDVAHTQPLTTVKGRGGMDINLALTYSSNIYSQVHCANNRAPTGWTGLGWRMGFGSIIRNHNGTKSIADDDFVWVSPTGVPNRIVKTSGIKCYVYAQDGRTWDNLPTDFSTEPLVDSSITSSIDLLQRSLYEEHFCLVFDGMLNMGGGAYTFTLTSDDGSKLYIDNNLVASNDGVHGCRSVENTVTLSGNRNRIRVEYFQKTGSRCLKVQYRRSDEPATMNREFTPGQLQPMVDMSEGAWDFGRYYLENDPYTRIEPKFDDDGNIIGWVVAATDGKRMYYGDAGSSSTDSSTRYTFAFGDYVGQGWGAAAALFPCQWDLNRIVDVAGNTLQFTYRQETEALKVGTWNSGNLTPPLYYTKASYLKSITTSEGKHVDFELETKPGGEPFDSYRFEDEPDGFMEVFESKRLRAVKVYSIPGTATETGRYTFSYSQHKDAGTDARYLKSYLTRITHVSNGQKGASTRFEYNTNFSSADVNYHEGALRRVVDEKSSAVTEFTYTRQAIPSGKTSDQPPDGTTRRSTYSGITGDGNPYVVCQGGSYEHPRHIEIFNWTGSKWEKKFDWHKMGYSDSYDVDVFAMKDHVVLRGGADDYIEILTWDGKRWFMSRSLTMHGDDDTPDHVYVYPGLDYVALLSGEYGNKLEILHWRDNRWVTSFPRQNVAVYEGNSDLVEIYPNGQHILVSSKRAVDIYTYNGVAWVKTLDNEIIDPSWDIQVHPGTNFYAFRLGERDRLMVKTWNGTSWTTTLPSHDLSMNSHDFEMKGFGEHILFRHNTDDYLQILSWTGSTWDSTFARNQITNSKFDFDKVGPDYIPLRHAADSYSNEMEILQWNATMTKWDTTFARQTVGLSDNHIYFFPCPDYVVIKVGSSLLEAYRNNGTSWNQAIFSAPFLSHSFEVSAAGPAFAILGSANELKCYYKYQDQFNEPLTAFTVTQKKVSDPYAKGGTALTTTCDYNLATNANFDTRAGCAKFNKVDILTTGSGKTSQYYFNDVATQSAIHPQYDDLDGMVYKTEHVNGSGVIIDSAKSTYEFFRKSYWPPTVRQKRVTTSSSWSNGLEFRNDLLSFNQWNGLPQITRTFNSDGTQKLMKTIFAFDCIHADYQMYMGGTFRYADRDSLVLGAYMLTAPFQTIVYEKAAGITTIEPAATEVRSAKAITYSNKLGCKAMLPFQNFVWKSGYNPDGTPQETFAKYNPYFGENPNWFLTGGMDIYNRHGSAIQTSNVNGVAATVLLSNDNTIPLMNVTNARHGHCLFTNWTENQPSEVNVATMSMSNVANDLHFAGRTMKLTTDATRPTADQYAVAAISPPNNSLAELGGKSFTVQFWAKAGGSTTTFFHLQALPGMVWSDSREISLTTAWKKYEYNVTFPAGVADKQFRLVLRPPHAGAVYLAGTIYYDDVRVTPKGAVSNVTYYDSFWRKPNLSLDANNNPSTKVVLDGLSRPSQVLKINPVRSVGASDFATLLQQKTYHSRSDLPADKQIQVLSPDGGESFIDPGSLVIRWVSDGTYPQVGLSYQQKTGPDTWGDPHGIGTVPNEPGGEYSYEWRTIPSGLNGEYRILASVGVEDDERDESDRVFYLSTPAAP